MLAIITKAIATAKTLKDQAEPLGQLVQNLGSETVGLLGAQGKSELCCHKCGCDWMVHSYYGANTNYYQCNCCGKAN